MGNPEKQGCVVRIRTIKPEFWKNEHLARLPEFTRLLAIGLLNYADDEGYFNANPSLIRGDLFPFLDDSKKVPTGITELSNLGYLKLYNAADGRTYGHVVKFTEHQWLTKAKESKIKPLCVVSEEAGIIPGMFSESSALDQGSGNKEQGTGKGESGAAVAAPSLPFSSEQFRNAWSDFEKHRREIKKPLRETSTKAVLAELKAMGELRAIAALKHTVAKGWQGIREPDAKSPNAAQATISNPWDEEPEGWRAYWRNKYPPEDFPDAVRHDEKQWCELTSYDRRLIYQGMKSERFTLSH